MKRTTAIGVFLAVCLSASGALADMIYWVSGYSGGYGNIYRAYLYHDPGGTHVTNIELLVEGWPSPRNLTLDLVHNKMYWSTVSSILRANLDGSGVEFLIHELATPAGIAIDANAGKIYWTKPSHWMHGARSYVLRMNFDCTELEVVAAPIEYNQPHGIALNLESSIIYWSEAGGRDGDYSLIRRANLNGSDAETILISDIHSWFLRAQTIDLDLPNGRIYWTDYYYHTAICRAQFDGSEDELVSWEPSRPYHIALDSFKNKLYRTRANQIVYMHIDGGGFSNLFPQSIAQPYGIALDLRTTDGDCTGDGFTDLEDYACFMLSLTGPAKSISMGLECSDLNSDGHIDLADFASFQNHFGAT